MKIGDLVHVVNIDDRPDATTHSGIIIDINPCEYMPAFHVYRFAFGSAIWLYQINVSLLNEA